MLRKLNTTLLAIAIVGAIICGGLYLYNSHSDINNSSFVQLVGGE